MLKLISKVRRYVGFLLAFAVVMGAIPVTEAKAEVPAGYTAISNAEELAGIRNNLSGNYMLTNDIDLTEYLAGKNDGWQSTGTFEGILDGNGHTISGLWGRATHGLFYIIDGAEIRNLNIVLSENGLTGGSGIGGLVGTARNDTVIENVTVSGGSIRGSEHAGGIVGYFQGGRNSRGTISNVKVSNTNIYTSANYSGGVVGRTWYTDITNSSAENITSEAGSYAGGFAGAIHHNSTISGSSAHGESVIARVGVSGGLLGIAYEQSMIERCYTVIKEVRADVYYAGGLVGQLHNGCSINQSCAYGDVKSKTYIAGGLVGEVAHTSTVSNSYARGNVSGTTGVGGLVGYFSLAGRNGHTVYNSYSTGVVSGNNNTLEVGAFSGHSGVDFNGTNYYNSEKAGVNIPHGTAGLPKGTPPVGKNTAEMMQQATFEGWDFDTIWKIEEGDTYPYFDFGDYIPETGMKKSAKPVINTLYEGDKSVTGTGIPGAIITVTFQDSSMAKVEVADNGKWTVNVPNNGELDINDLVTAVQKEAGKLTSDSTQKDVLRKVDIESLKVVKDWSLSGNTLTITVTVTNTSDDITWETVILNEYLNSKVTYNDESGSSGAVYDDDDHMIEVDLGDMAPDTSETLTYKVTITGDVSKTEDLDSITIVTGN